MKTQLLFMACIIISVLTFGQEKKEYADQIKGAKVVAPAFLGVAQTTPVVPDNRETIGDYMAKNVQYPAEAVKYFKQGTAIVLFTVLPDGKLSDIKMINSVSPEIDAEVIRVLKTTDGMWKPGLNNNNPVAMEKEVSVAFKVTGIHNYDYAYLGKFYFTKGSKMLFSKNAPQKALKYYNKGIKILPKDKSLLLMRGLARYNLGDEDGACQDWNRIKTLGGLESEGYLKNLCEMKGYNELVDILKK